MLGNRISLKADAVLFATSKIGVMAIEYIASLGLKIPDDVALVSFDNADAYKICISPVTVVGQPFKEIGKTAVQVLMNEIAHSNDSLKFQKITLKTEFIVRKSCGS